MRFLLVLLLIWFVSAPAVVSQDEAVFGDLVSVELVLVDVFVDSADGQPLLDLKQGDFELFEDGKPVEIGYFAPPPMPAVAGTSTAANPSPAEAAIGLPPRRVVIFVDNLHLHPNSRRRVFDKLSNQLDHHLV